MDAPESIWWCKHRYSYIYEDAPIAEILDKENCSERSYTEGCRITHKPCDARRYRLVAEERDEK